MITQLQETWKIQNKVAYNFTMYYNDFLSREIKIFSWGFNNKLSKINRMSTQKSKRRPEKKSRPEKHHDSHNGRVQIRFKFPQTVN